MLSRLVPPAVAQVARQLRQSPLGQRASEFANRRSTRTVLGLTTAGCLVWEVVDFFAGQHEEGHGMAELYFGLPAHVREARQAKETQFRALMDEARRRQQAGNSQGAAECAHDAHHVLCPSLTPEEARARRERFGPAAWTEQAITTIVALSPLDAASELPPQWLSGLMEAGATMCAPRSPATGSGAQRPSEDARALLLVFPAASPAAAERLKRYDGGILVYVGEPRGGVNADEAFFDVLGGGGWVLEDTVSLAPLPDCYERLWVLRRAASPPAGSPGHTPAPLT